MFKYFSFSEYALANILNDELYMNHYEAFNDPFECWATVTTGFPNKNDKSNRLLSIYKAWGFDNLDDKNANENYDIYSESLVDTQLDIPSIVNSARITCFSKRADNLLMWSHYADGLRGFCLEFDRDILLVNELDNVKSYDVEYKENPAVIDTALIATLQDQIEHSFDALDSCASNDETSDHKEHFDKSLAESNDIFKKMLATKPINWQYEEEIRVIYQSMCDSNTGEFLKYPSQAIKSVIVGEKMPEKQVSALKYLFESHPFAVEFKTAKRAKESFNVIIE